MAEAARLLGVAEITVRRLIRAGKLEAYKAGRVIRIRRSAIVEYYKRHVVGVTP